MLQLLMKQNVYDNKLFIYDSTYAPHYFNIYNSIEHFLISNNKTCGTTWKKALLKKNNTKENLCHIFMQVVHDIYSRLFCGLYIRKYRQITLRCFPPTTNKLLYLISIVSNAPWINNFNVSSQVWDPYYLHKFKNTFHCNIKNRYRTGIIIRQNISHH